MADEQSIPRSTTTVADPSRASSWRQGRRLGWPQGRRLGWPQVHPALVVVIAVVLAALLGWIIAGVPGLGASRTLGLVLILVSLASGALTLVFIVRALRRAGTHERRTRGEGMAVLISSAITAIISIAQMIQVVQQILR